MFVYLMWVLQVGEIGERGVGLEVVFEGPK